MNEQITTTADPDRGLYAKFSVARTDPDAEARHQGCEFFVLDLSHDPHAVAAIAAYADSCRADFPQLAVDLDAKAGGPATLPTEAEVAEALIQYETSGMCHYGRTCALCDCRLSDATPEQLRVAWAMQRDRARAVLALFAPAADRGADQGRRMGRGE